MRALVVVVAILALGCQTAPPAEPVYPPAPPFVGDVDAACASACSNLRRLGCPEGSGAISGETCDRRCVVAMELRSMPLECWTRAESVVAAKSCGSLRCVR